MQDGTKSQRVKEEEEEEEFYKLRPANKTEVSFDASRTATKKYYMCQSTCDLADSPTARLMVQQLCQHDAGAVF